jgi:hypothetical protein
MSLSFASVVKEGLTVGHGFTVVAGVYVHKAYIYLKAKVTAVEGRLEAAEQAAKKALQ